MLNGNDLRIKSLIKKSGCMKRLFVLGLLSLTLGTSSKAQVTERPRPAEWERLVPGHVSWTVFCRCLTG